MRYSKIDKMEYCNGEGFGVSVFVQGCHFHCKGCFNPETWDFNGGRKWGQEQVDLVLKLLGNPHITRLSILGGEPLAYENLIGVLNLVAEVRRKFRDSKQIWLYTGSDVDRFLFQTIFLDDVDFLAPQLRQDIVSLCDYVVDGRFEEDKKDLSLAFRGSSNQRIIDIKKTLSNTNNKIVLKEV